MQHLKLFAVLVVLAVVAIEFGLGHPAKSAPLTEEEKKARAEDRKKKSECAANCRKKQNGEDRAGCVRDPNRNMNWSQTSDVCWSVECYGMIEDTSRHPGKCLQEPTTAAPDAAAAA